ncbi:MAG TPA: DUF503 domain-containing protein [Anaerolineaceae bacterium]|nr:DUF503 domain-containing protein [Anaerolineaceae bacterium]
MAVGLLTLHFHLPGCASLKEKRSRIKPILARLHREFNVSAAELARQDAWQEAVLACALVSNDAAFAQKALQEVVAFVERTWPDEPLIDEKIEVF